MIATSATRVTEQTQPEVIDRIRRQTEQGDHQAPSPGARHAPRRDRHEL